MKHIISVVFCVLLIAFFATTVLGANGTVLGGAKKSSSTKKVIESDNFEKPSMLLENGAPYQELVVPKLIRTTAAPMSGIYRIGAAQSYPSISSALTALAINGISGPVTFYLTDAAYTDAGLLIGSVTGASAVNTITFKPDSLTNVVVTLTSSSANGGGWVFSGSSYITIDGTRKNSAPGSQGLTIKFDPAQVFPSSSLAAPIRIRDGCSHITIMNTIIYSMYKSDLSDARPGISTSAGTVPNKFITIQNNRIATASAGIFAYGGYPNAMDSSIRILNNQVGGAYGPTAGANQTDYCQHIGIEAFWSFGTIISGNIVNGVHRNVAAYSSALGRTAGIYGNFTNSTMISNNIIKDVKMTVSSTSTSSSNRLYGIRAYGFSGAYGGPSATLNTVANNSITDIMGYAKTTYRDFGISVEDGRTDYVYYNTVKLAGANLTSTGGASACLQVTGLDDYSKVADLRVYNNVFENIRTGAGASQSGTIRPFNNSGQPDITFANNNVHYHTVPYLDLSAQYSSVYEEWMATLLDSASSDNNPYLITVGDTLAVDNTQPSSAMQLGTVLVDVTTDIGGRTRPATAPNPTAGCYEVSGLSTMKDAGAIAILTPTSSGFPINVPIPTAVVVIRNYGINTESFTAELKVSDPTGTPVGTFTSGIRTVAGFNNDTITFPLALTPTVAGLYEFKAYTQLAGDINADNDTVATNPPCVPLIDPSAGYSTDFEPGNFAGWNTTGDFIVDVPANPGPHFDWSLYDAGFPPEYYQTLIGGHIPTAHSGTQCAITQNGIYGPEGYSSLTVSTLYSPYFDFRGFVNPPYISFYHSIATEPAYDGSNFQYSFDSGKTWQQLGALSDVRGINWLDTLVYTNANVTKTGQFDQSTAKSKGFADNITGIWTSDGDYKGSRKNGTDLATGPFGFIYAEYHLPSTFVGKNYVRFRYQFWGDGNSNDDGAAFDDFAIKTTGATNDASIAGVKFMDIAGDGIFNPPDTLLPGIWVKCDGGAIHDSVQTGVGGTYQFSNLPPGLYKISEKTPAGYAISVPATGSYILPVSPGEVITGKDIGNFHGYISGMKWLDTNRNAVKDINEPGLAGWTIQAHKDSCKGTVVASQVTDANGNYIFALVPGTYYITEVQKTGWVETIPSPNCVAITIAAPSGSSAFTGVNFGNYKSPTLGVLAYQDFNGDGVKGPDDIINLPSGVRLFTETSRNGIVIYRDTIGNTSEGTFHLLADTGTFIIKRVGALPTGWVVTLPDQITEFVTFATDTIRAQWGAFKLTTASGIKFDDKNGNGVWDNGEPPLAGWTMTDSGNGGSSAITDANGFFKFFNLGPGTHKISETQQAGWVQTKPASGVYRFETWTQTSVDSVDTTIVFGNFKTYCISGTKFRDRNNNGQRDPGEEGIAGWDITLDGNVVATTDANGNYQICGVLPGSHTLAEVAQTGWTCTYPPGGSYTVSSTSGTDVSGKDFGNFLGNDAKKYRTWTASYLSSAACNAVKALKPPKIPTPPKKQDNIIPGKTNATIANLVTLVGSMSIGNTGGDPKKGPPFLQTSKLGDVWTTLCDKQKTHSGAARGMDVGFKGLMLGKFKSISALKIKDDILIADLLALKINIAASLAGNTTAGFSTLIYNEDGNPLKGMTIEAIAAAAENAMQNWGGHPYSDYVLYDTVVAKINASFFDVFFGYDTAAWKASAAGPYVVNVKGVKTVYDVPFLKANPGATPKNPMVNPYAPLPDVYSLDQNYPNPFNPTTKISFDLPEQAFVSLKIYNILGQEVATLFDRQLLDAGQQDIDFDAYSLASGVYLYRIVAEGVNDDGLESGNTFTQVKKMVLMK